MNQRIDAIYENGHFRPLSPLDLAEHQRVILVVESPSDTNWIDEDASTWAAAEGDSSISLDEVRKRLSGIKGSFADVIVSERGEY